MATIKTLIGNVKGQTGEKGADGKDGSENQIYSYDETPIGTWVSGEIIYRKVIPCGTLPNKTDKTVAHGISNFNHIIQVSGFCKDADKSKSYPLPFPYDNGSTGVGSIGIWVDKTNITISCLGTYYPNIIETYVILEYTKTT